MNSYLFLGFLATILVILCYYFPKKWMKSNNSSLISFIPTFCTSLGVLFSFFLLFVTLGLQDIDMTDLRHLVKELSSKFLYSLIGVGFSIGWNWKIKKKQGESELELAENNYWKREDPQKLLWQLLQSNLGIERKFEDYVLSQNNNYLEQLKATNGNNIEIIDQLKALNSQSLNIKKTIEVNAESQSEMGTSQQDTLDSISDFMQSAGDSLKGLLDDLKNQLENNIKAMGSDAAEKAAELHRVFEGFLKDQASQMEERMANDMKDVHEKIHPALNSISEATNNSTNELKGTLNSINTVLENMQINLTRQINEQVQTAEINVENRTRKFEEITTSKANELSTEFDKIHSVLQDLNSGLQKSIDGILKEKEEQIRKTFDHLEELRGRSETFLTQTTEKFASSVEIYSNVQQNNEEIIKRLETQIKSIDSLQATSEKNIDHWNSKVDKMEEVKNRVADIANTIGQLENINQKLGLLSPQNN